MPALPTITADFLTAIQNKLSVGTDLGSDMNSEPVNYLRVQDLTSALELLQNELGSGTLTATGGTATTVVDGASTFVADTQVGNVVTFDGNVTAALAGHEAVVISNTTTTLTFASLPGTPAIGDTFSIRAAFLDAEITALRSGKPVAVDPVANLYGDYGLVYDAYMKLIGQLKATFPTQTLSHASLAVAAGATDTAIPLNLAMRVDQHKGDEIEIDGETRKIINNNETTVYVAPALANGAPAAAEAAVIRAPKSSPDSREARLLVHPGAKSGENLFLEEVLAVAKAAVVAYTTPA